MTDLEFVAFDLETTGFDVNDEITVAGFALPLGCGVFMQSGGHGTDDDVDETALKENGATAVFISHLVGEIREMAAHDVTVDGIEAVGLVDSEREATFYDRLPEKFD